MATLINPQPEDSALLPGADSSQSALELLKPDPPIDNATENNDGEEADLEALRQAALLSIRPKKSAFKVQAHPVRANLLSIVPVEEEEKPEKKVVKPFASRQPAAARDSPSKTNKFNRHLDSDKSSESESEYEEIEVEEEVTATESETETETTASKENKKEHAKRQVSEADDILNVDCSEEVDEFTNFLNEFEDDLKPKEPKPKKTKKIMVKKRVKKEKPVKSRNQQRKSTSRTRSRSPGPLRSRRTPPRSPLRRYSPRSRYSPPPYYRRRNSRSPSPYYRRPRRYSRTPSPRRRSPRPFRSPRRAGSPRRYNRYVM